MTKDELISKQQLDIETLKLQIAIADKCRKDIHATIYCIGGPLNDNKLKYSGKQLIPFSRIAEILNLT